MRLALVQLGPGLPRLSEQVEAMKAFEPEAYHIEEGANMLSARRVVERLERLTEGDALCITDLDCLRTDVGEALLLAGELMARGVSIHVLSKEIPPLILGKASRDRLLLGLFADLYRRRGPAHSLRHTGGGEDMLTPDQVDEIRRLHRGGLSPRRIGLIFRRSPNAISALVAEAARPAKVTTGKNRASVK